jgi:cytochrome c
MKASQLFSALLCVIAFVACSGEKDKTDSYNINDAIPVAAEKDLASTRIDLVNKGIGPITSVELGETINEELVKEGQRIYQASCVICHKAETKFIGPAPKGILQRRTPEWVMNMILNPGRMLKDDPLAKDLFMEFNGSPMSNMNLTEDQARAVLEYFRTL